MKKVLWIFIGLILLELMMRLGGAVHPTLRDPGGPNSSLVDQEDSFRILCLGESTTQDSSGHTWPEQLEPMLNEESTGRVFKVINGGVSGTNTALIVSRLEGNLETYRPHLVITMMGQNDETLEARYEKTSGARMLSLCDEIRLCKMGLLLWDAVRIQATRVDRGSGAAPDAQRPMGGNDERSPGPGREEKSIDEHTYAEVAEHYRALGRPEDAEEILAGDEKLNAEGLYQRYINLKRSFQYQGNSEKAVEMLKKAIELFPERINAYVELGMICQKLDRLEEAERVLKKAKEIDPDHYGVTLELGYTYHAMGKAEMALEMAREAMEITPNDCNDNLYNLFVKCFKTLNTPAEEIEELYRAMGLDFKIEKGTSVKEITRYHYMELYKILKKHGIPLMAMQYATRDVGPLMDLFPEQEKEEILFVSNKDNFQEALLNGKYEDYFIDKCYGDIGHATKRGNRLIAENVANAVRGMLEQEEHGNDT